MTHATVSSRETNVEKNKVIYGYLRSFIEIVYSDISLHDACNIYIECDYQRMLLTVGDFNEAVDLHVCVCFIIYFIVQYFHDAFFLIVFIALLMGHVYFHLILKFFSIYVFSSCTFTRCYNLSSFIVFFNSSHCMCLTHFPYWTFFLSYIIKIESVILDLYFHICF